MEARDIHVLSLRGGDHCDIEDIAVLLGLRIIGPPITGTDKRDWVGKCDRLLGVVPLLMAIHGDR